MSPRLHRCTFSPSVTVRAHRKITRHATRANTVIPSPMSALRSESSCSIHATHAMPFLHSHPASRHILPSFHHERDVTTSLPALDAPLLTTIPSVHPPFVTLVSSTLVRYLLAQRSSCATEVPSLDLLEQFLPSGRRQRMGEKVTYLSYCTASELTTSTLIVIIL